MTLQIKALIKKQPMEAHRLLAAQPQLRYFLMKAGERMGMFDGSLVKEMIIVQNPAAAAKPYVKSKEGALHSTAHSTHAHTHTQSST